MGGGEGSYQHVLSLTLSKQNDDGVMECDLSSRYRLPSIAHVSLGTLELHPSQLIVEDDETRHIRRCMIEFSEGTYKNPAGIPRENPIQTAVATNETGDALTLRVTTLYPHKFADRNWTNFRWGFGVAMTPSGLRLPDTLAVESPHTLLMTFAADARAAVAMQCAADARGAVVISRLHGWGSEPVAPPVSIRVRVPAGNYDTRSLAGTIGMFMEGLKLPAGACIRVYGATGEGQTVIVGTGSYTTVAFVENLVNKQLESIKLTLRFAVNSEQRLVISSDDRSVFGLEFREGKDQSAARAFGFQAVHHGGESVYTGSKEVALPASRSYSWTCDPNCNKLSLHSDAQHAVAKNGFVHRTLAVSEGDVVYVPQRGLARVKQVDVAFRDVPGEAPQVGQRVQLHEFDIHDTRCEIFTGIDAHHALRVGTPLVANAIQAAVLGFDGGENIAPVHPRSFVYRGPSTQTTEACCDASVEHVPFVIVELLINGNQANSEFTSVGTVGGRNVLPFAKVCFAPYRTERVNPAQVALGGEIPKVSSIGIRLYNPDHTLYNTHGRPVSISLVLTTLHQYR